MVAQTTGPPGFQPSLQQALRLAQVDVADGVATYRGPNADLLGYQYRQAVSTYHFNAAGVTEEMQKDVRISITNASGKNVYPICSFTYLLIPKHISDPQKKEAIKGFLHWMLTSGQNMVEALDYAKLPRGVVAVETKAISEVE